MRFQNAFYSGMVRVMKGMRKKEMESDSDSEEGCGGLEGHSSGKEPLTLSLSLSLCILQNPLWKLHAFPQICH